MGSKHMVERGLNIFWIALGVAAGAHSWQIGLTGPSGPESGLFPLIAGTIIAGAGFTLLLRPSSTARDPQWPRGAGMGRVAGVVAGIAVMAIGVNYLGFVVASAATMMVLLRTIERSNWVESVSLAVGSVAVVAWLFGQVLGMPLPRGPWGW